MTIAPTPFTGVEHINETVCQAALVHFVQPKRSVDANTPEGLNDARISAALNPGERGPFTAIETGKTGALFSSDCYQVENAIHFPIDEEGMRVSSDGGDACTGLH